MSQKYQMAITNLFYWIEFVLKIQSDYSGSTFYGKRERSRCSKKEQQENEEALNFQQQTYW